MLQAPILRFDTLDSTNNRAAQIIDADKAQAGLTIVARQQSAGRGQRGNSWIGLPNQALLMSIVLQPKMAIEAQFSFSAAVAVSIVEVLKSLDRRLDLSIKFPNDIIINDKKAAGILIENSIRGNQWTHAIVGIGLNVLQHHFDPNLPNANSLFLATQKEWVIEGLLLAIRKKIIENTMKEDLKTYIQQYNQLLYKRTHKQRFAEAGEQWEAIICRVNENGMIELKHNDGTVKAYPHGVLQWIW